MEISVGLKNKTKFEQILVDYHISERGRKILGGLQLVILVGFASSGRNTIIRELETTGKYAFIISDTTRQPKIRDGVLEQNGVQYYFRSEEDILTDLQNGEFLEAALIHGQQVSGISMRELEKAASHHMIAINEVEIIGADNIVRAKPDTLCCFVLPPSFEEWQNRLQAREVMTDEEFKNRMKSAEKELHAALNKPYYKFVINDDVRGAARFVDELVDGREYNATMRSVGLELAEDFLEKLHKEVLS